MPGGRKAVTFNEEKPVLFEYEATELPKPPTPEKKEQSEERKQWFQNFMAVSMGIREPVALLDEVSFEGVAKFIASGQCTNIITMAGAGISTSAGIPDYRSPGTGLFAQCKKKYPAILKAEDIFNLQYFMRDPHPFFDRSRRFFGNSLKPTPCHYFVRLLNEKGLLLRHFTQNIDTLERIAGLPRERVVEAHGSFHTSHCMDCEKEYTFTWMREILLNGDEDTIPRCEEADCNGVVKPDIIMYGESLDESFGERVEEDTLRCDLLIILGTALAVVPFSCMTSKVKTSTPRLYINLDRGKTSKRHPMSDLMFGAGFDFDSVDNYRDVYKGEKCDTAVYQMADILGWGDELRTLVDTEHQRIDKENKAKGIEPSPPIEEEATPVVSPPEPETQGNPATTSGAGGGGGKSEPSTSKASSKTPWMSPSRHDPHDEKPAESKKKTSVAGVPGRKTSEPKAGKFRRESTGKSEGISSAAKGSVSPGSQKKSSTSRKGSTGV